MLAPSMLSLFCRLLISRGITFTATHKWSAGKEDNITTLLHLYVAMKVNHLVVGSWQNEKNYCQQLISKCVTFTLSFTEADLLFANVDDCSKAIKMDLRLQANSNDSIDSICSLKIDIPSSPLSLEKTSPYTNFDSASPNGDLDIYNEALFSENPKNIPDTCISATHKRLCDFALSSQDTNRFQPYLEDSMDSVHSLVIDIPGSPLPTPKTSPDINCDSLRPTEDVDIYDDIFYSTGTDHQKNASTFVDGDFNMKMHYSGRPKNVDKFHIKSEDGEDQNSSPIYEINKSPFSLETTDEVGHAKPRLQSTDSQVSTLTVTGKSCSAIVSETEDIYDDLFTEDQKNGPTSPTGDIKENLYDLLLNMKDNENISFDKQKDDQQLYDDLLSQEHIDQQENLKNLQENFQLMSSQNKCLSERFEKVSEELRNLQKRNIILVKNISSLFQTARLEIQRKDKEIDSLRRQLDNLIFRKNTRFNANRVGIKNFNHQASEKSHLKISDTNTIQTTFRSELTRAAQNRHNNNSNNPHSSGYLGKENTPEKNIKGNVLHSDMMRLCNYQNFNQSRDVKRNKLKLMNKQDNCNNLIPPDTLEETFPLVKDTLPEPFPLVKDTLPEPFPLVKDTLQESFPLVKDTLRETFPQVKDTLQETFPLIIDTLTETSLIAKDTIVRTDRLLKTAQKDTRSRHSKVSGSEKSSESVREPEKKCASLNLPNHPVVHNCERSHERSQRTKEIFTLNDKVIKSKVNNPAKTYERSSRAKETFVAHDKSPKSAHKRQSNMSMNDKPESIKESVDKNVKPNSSKNVSGSAQSSPPWKRKSDKSFRKDLKDEHCENKKPRKSYGPPCRMSPRKRHHSSSNDDHSLGVWSKRSKREASPHKKVTHAKPANLLKSPRSKQYKYETSLQMKKAHFKLEKSPVTNKSKHETSPQKKTSHIKVEKLLKSPRGKQLKHDASPLKKTTHNKLESLPKSPNTKRFKNEASPGKKTARIKLENLLNSPDAKKNPTCESSPRKKTACKKLENLLKGSSAKQLKHEASPHKKTAPNQLVSLLRNPNAKQSNLDDSPLKKTTNNKLENLLKSPNTKRSKNEASPSKKTARLKLENLLKSPDAKKK